MLVALDLFTKKMAFVYLADIPGNRVEVLSIFNLVMVWNRGVSFGMFNNLENPQIVLSIITGLITIFLFSWLLKATSRYVANALTLIISGALGNIIDRVINGAVADFLDFHIGMYHWPAFNLADSFITVGAILLLFEELFLKLYQCYQKKS